MLAALLAGAALAVAGTTVQAVCRNPLAEPGLLGITGGAGVGAVALITLAPLAGIWAMTAVAGARRAARVRARLRPGLARRRAGLRPAGARRHRRLQAGLYAVITFIIVVTDPWNTGKALTWLSGSTYGRTPAQVMPGGGGARRPDAGR